MFLPSGVILPISTHTKKACQDFGKDCTEPIDTLERLAMLVTSHHATTNTGALPIWLGPHWLPRSPVVISAQLLHAWYQELEAQGPGEKEQVPSPQTHAAKSHQDEIAPYYVPEEQRAIF